MNLHSITLDILVKSNSSELSSIELMKLERQLQEHLANIQNSEWTNALHFHSNKYIRELPKS